MILVYRIVRSVDACNTIAVAMRATSSVRRPSKRGASNVSIATLRSKISPMSRPTDRSANVVPIERWRPKRPASTFAAVC